MEHYLHLAPETEVIFFPDEPVVYASFWERLAASFIDGLILILPISLLQYFVPNLLGLFLIMAAIWFYSAFQEAGSSQATIGKKAVNLKVVTTDGERLSFGQATGRHFGKWVSAIMLMIGFLLMLWDEKKQTLHDKMSDALVVKK